MRFRRTFNNHYVWFHKLKDVSPVYYIDMDYIANILGKEKRTMQEDIANYIYVQKKCQPIFPDNVLILDSLLRADYAFEYLIRFQNAELLLWMKKVLYNTNPTLRTFLDKWNWSDDRNVLNLPKNQIFSETVKTILTNEQKVQYYDTFVKRGPLVNIRNTAKMLNVKQSQFVDFLFKQGLCYYDRHKKIFPYAEYVGRLFQIKEYHTESHDGIQTLITPLGRKIFEDLLTKDFSFERLQFID